MIINYLNQKIVNTHTIFERDLFSRLTIRVINATFNNILVISWQSVLLVEYTEKTTDLS